ncbi:MAG TPA: FeoB small GTPase domain-containing protein, partial [Spirochaetia bacterium]|nr:FeoB small GTPase domain-containing protein [Spirochaetia bacterium]
MSLSCHGAVNEVRGRTDFVFALAGNPNVGKSSIFNTLTGTGAVTANYPGKTVEINVASTRLGELRIGLVDLPGTYALGAVSEDQWVARQGILDGNPDAVIVILDATNLARNLYMLLQLQDMGFPVVAALNLFDQARKKGIETDIPAMSRILGIPVIPTVATHGEGLEELLTAAVTTVRSARKVKGRCAPGADAPAAGAPAAGAPAATVGAPAKRAYGADVENVVQQLSV